MNRSRLRAIPAVEKVLQALGQTELPRSLVVMQVRAQLAALRKEGSIPSFETVLERIRTALAVLRRSRIQTVINGTGVVIHTNLGRSPLSRRALDELMSAGSGYSNLEYDLSAGKRGGRADYLEKGLAALCGAEGATVVNNCAAALLLILRHFTAAKPEVVVSRGELVQIGGGFRIPEILEASGARLREIGTTNRTSLRDYERGIREGTGLLLKVHRSNFFMEGFVEAPSTEEIAALARRKRIPFVEDLGSGALVATERVGGDADAGWAPDHEPTPAEVLRKGADLVCFSGDKLMGGPQAGIIAGKRKWVAALKREPFFRALRCDKLVLTALQATVEDYLRGEPVPVLQLMSLDEEALRRRAESMVKALHGLKVKAGVGTGESQVGGGTLPRCRIPSVTLDLLPDECGLAEFSARLRRGAPPVVGYVSGNRLKIDLRTVLPDQDELVVEAIRTAQSDRGGGDFSP